MSALNKSSIATNTAAIVAATGTTVAVLTSAVWWVWLQRRRANDDSALRQAQDRRQEERTGRIRAEVKLRQVSKQLQQLQAHTDTVGATTEAAGTNGNGNDKNKNKNDNNSSTTTMILRSIGTVTSPYTKRMGTPRQPQLVPSSRGFIEFTCPAAALDGMDDYSHVWIIFEFHAK